MLLLQNIISVNFLIQAVYVTHGSNFKYAVWQVKLQKRKINESYYLAKTKGKVRGSSHHHTGSLAEKSYSAQVLLI